MLDRPEGWEILALLAPIALVMNWIRVRELRASCTSYAELTDPQKVWLVCMALSPGASARLLAALDDEERRDCIEQARSLRGTGQLLVPRVLKEVGRELAWDLGRARDPDEVATLLSRHAEADAGRLAESLRSLWSFTPPQDPEEEAAPEPASASVEEAPAETPAP